MHMHMRIGMEYESRSEFEALQPRMEIQHTNILTHTISNGTCICIYTQTFASSNAAVLQLQIANCKQNKICKQNM
jgi:hypothetical protein